MPSRAGEACGHENGNGRRCHAAVGHDGVHLYDMQMLFSDPRYRSPTAVPSNIRPFLIELAIDGWFCLKDRRPGREFVIQQIGAMCDEDSDCLDLEFSVEDLRVPIDRRYLSQIWPRLWKLPLSITVEAGADLQINFDRKAIVVIAGVAQ